MVAEPTGLFVMLSTVATRCGGRRLIPKGRDSLPIACCELAPPMDTHAAAG